MKGLFGSQLYTIIGLVTKIFSIFRRVETTESNTHINGGAIVIGRYSGKMKRTVKRTGSLLKTARSQHQGSQSDQTGRTNRLK